MKHSLLNSWKNSPVVLWIAVLLLTLVSFLQPATHLEPGLDNAWAFALNYAFEKKWIFGTDIIFTFGPLGFLEHTRLVSDYIFFISSLFWFVVTFSTNFFMIRIATLTSSPGVKRWLNLLFAVLVLLVVFPNAQKLLLLVYSLIFLHWIEKKIGYLMAASLATICCLFIKFSYGISSLALFGAYLLLLGIVYKNIRYLFIGMASIAFFYFFVWWLVYGHLGGAFSYFIGGVYLANGNSSAMAENPENNGWAIAGFYMAIVLAAVIFHRGGLNKFRWYALIYIPSLFVWIKYAFSQEGPPHLYPLLDFALLFLCFAFLAVNLYREKMAVLSLMSITFFSWIAMHTDEMGPPDYVNLPHFSGQFFENVKIYSKPYRQLAIWRHAEEEKLSPLLLPEKIKKIIGEKTVDIYPWELNFVAANKLNWKPRPLFQNYITYLPVLDQKNYNFYSSKNAPKFIIWHHHDFQDIKGRYAFNTDPLTLEAILKNYKEEFCENSVCLWEHVDESQLVIESNHEFVNANWQEWIDIPGNLKGIVRVKVAAERTIFGKLNLFLWKEGGVYIDYKLEDGSVKTHEIIIDNARSGLWASPYYSVRVNALRNTPPLIIAPALIVYQKSAEGYIEKIEDTGLGSLFYGWAVGPSADIKHENIYIDLVSKDADYLFSSKRVSRPDVELYFQNKGRPGIDQVGFSSELKYQDIPEGHYQVRLLIESDGDWFSVPGQQYEIYVSHSAAIKQVKSLRFRTTRSWAFSSTIKLMWEEIEINQGEIIP